MLLKIYKTNQPLILTTLPLVALILWLPSFKLTSHLKLENTTFVFDLLTSDSVIINNIIAISLILISAIIVNATINKNEFFHKNFYITAFLYLLLSSAVPNLNTLHPLLYSNLFVILAFKRLVNIHSQVSCKSEVFDSTLLFLVAGLFYPPTLFLIPFSWLALVIFRPFKLKEWLTPLLALIIFLTYYFSVLLFFPEAPTFTLKNIANYSTYGNNSHSYLFYSISFLSSLFFILGLYQIHKKRQHSTIRFKKMSNSISSFFVWALCMFVITYSLTQSFEFLYLLSIPFTISISYFFIYFKNKKITELAFILLTVLVLLNNYI